MQKMCVHESWSVRRCGSRACRPMQGRVCVGRDKRAKQRRGACIAAGRRSDVTSARLLHRASMLTGSVSLALHSAFSALGSPCFLEKEGKLAVLYLRVVAEPFSWDFLLSLLPYPFLSRLHSITLSCVHCL